MGNVYICSAESERKLGTYGNKKELLHLLYQAQSSTFARQVMLTGLVDGRYVHAQMDTLEAYQLALAWKE